MKFNIFALLLLLISVNLSAETKMDDIDNISIKSIVQYYDYLDRKEFKKAYDKSNKTIEFEIYKSWYDSLKDIHILDIETLSDTKYRFDVIMVETDINTVYRYNVTFTMDKDIIVRSESSDISDSVNSSNTYSLVNNRTFRSFEYYNTRFADTIYFDNDFNHDNENNENTYIYSFQMGDQVGYYFVLGSKVYLNMNSNYYDSVLIFYNDPRSVLGNIILTLNENIDSFISKTNLENKKFDKKWWSDQKPEKGTKVNFNGHSVTLVNNEIFDYDILDKVYTDIKELNNPYRISLIRTANFVSYRWLEGLIGRTVIGYTMHNDKKYYLVVASFRITSKTDDVNTLMYYTNDRELYKLEDIFGWVPEEDIIKK